MTSHMPLGGISEKIKAEVCFTCIRLRHGWWLHTASPSCEVTCRTPVSMPCQLLTYRLHAACPHHLPLCLISQYLSPCSVHTSHHHHGFCPVQSLLVVILTYRLHAACPHDLPHAPCTLGPPAAGPQVVAAQDGCCHGDVEHQQDEAVAGEGADVAALGQVTGARLGLKGQAKHYSVAVGSGKTLFSGTRLVRGVVSHKWAHWWSGQVLVCVVRSQVGAGAPRLTRTALRW